MSKKTNHTATNAAIIAAAPELFEALKSLVFPVDNNGGLDSYALERAKIENVRAAKELIARIGNASRQAS